MRHQTIPTLPATKWLFGKTGQEHDDIPIIKHSGLRDLLQADNEARNSSQLMLKNRRQAWNYHLPKKFQQSVLPLLELTSFRERFRKNDFIAAILALVALLFALFAVTSTQNEIYWRDDYKATIGVHFMRVISMILSFVNLIFIYRHYALELELKKAYQTIDPLSKV